MQNSKEYQREIRCLPQWPLQRNRGKQQNGKTRDLFQKKRKKIRATKGTLNAKMGTKKVHNGMDLTEAEEIKKRCKNKQKNYTKKGLNTQIVMIMWSFI